MKGVVLVVGLSTFACVAALFYPYIGLIGYTGFVVLCPQYVWKWSLPEIGFQFYMAICTMIGFVLSGFRRNHLTGLPLASCVAFVCFTILAYLSAMQSVNPGPTWWYMGVLKNICVMTIMTALLLDSPGKILAAIWVVVLAQGYHAWEVNHEYLSLGYSWTAVNGRNFLDNNTYSISTMPIMAMSMSLAIHAEKRWQRWLAAAIFVLQLHQLLMLESRGCYLGGLLMLVIGFYMMPKRANTWFAVIALVAIGATLAGPSVVEEFMTIFSSEQELDESAASRFDLWKAGTSIMMSMPLLGAGPNAANYVIHHHSNFVMGKALHNLFFEVGAGCGIPAVIFYCTFYITIWWAMLRVGRDRDLPPWLRIVRMSVLAGVPGFWLSSIFSSGGLIESPYVLVALGAAAVHVFRTQPAYVTIWVPTHLLSNPASWPQFALTAAQWSSGQFSQTPPMANSEGLAWGDTAPPQSQTA